MKFYFDFMSFLIKRISSVIYLLLLLSIGIGSTIPLDKSYLQYSGQKLTDGVPTPSHFGTGYQKQHTQSQPPVTSSDVPLPFPEVHVTSEVRTVSLQITEDGVPIVTGIVNPIVFAKEPRSGGTFFEPTEVEAPVSTPTSTSLVNNSTIVDNLVTVRSPDVRQSIDTNLSADLEGAFVSPATVLKGTKKQSLINLENVGLVKEIADTGISRKPKRISSSTKIKDYSETEFPTKSSQRYGGEEVPSSYLVEDNDEDILSGIEIILAKRQEKKIDQKLQSVKSHENSRPINLTNGSEKIHNHSLGNINNLSEEDIEDGEVVELKSSAEKRPVAKIPVIMESSQDEASLWRKRGEFEMNATPQEDREFTIEKIHKEGISQFLRNSKEIKHPKREKEHLVKTKANEVVAEEGSEDINAEGSNTTGKDEPSVYMDLMDARSLDKQVPRAILKSQEKILLKASEEIFQSNEIISGQEDAEIITSNISRRNVTSGTTRSGHPQSSVKSSSSHMVQGVVKSRSLEPYDDELFNQVPSSSPKDGQISPISEQIDGDLAPGCVAAIVLGVLLCALAAMGSLAFVVYNRHSGIRPKMFSSDRSCANSDSGGYFDDQCRVAYLNSQSDVSKGTPEDLVSLDNDSFLNSLESMTIQNLWTDSIKHTKL